MSAVLVEVVIETDPDIYPDDHDMADTAERAIRALFDGIPGVRVQSISAGRLQ